MLLFEQKTFSSFSLSPQVSAVLFNKSSKIKSLPRKWQPPTSAAKPCTPLWGKSHVWSEITHLLSLHYGYQHTIESVSSQHYDHYHQEKIEVIITTINRIMSSGSQSESQHVAISGPTRGRLDFISKLKQFTSVYNMMQKNMTCLFFSIAVKKTITA